MTEPNGQPKKRYTLRELAQRAAGADGWSCRVCGCRDWRVTHTDQRKAGRVRLRRCRNCGSVLHTLETPIDDE